MRISVLTLVFLLVVLGLTGCASTSPAPVIERAALAKKPSARSKIPRDGDWRPQSYAVQKGDTLYGIALEHGLDYKEIAEWNGIEPPYTIRIGQQLRMTATTTTLLKPSAVVEPKSADPLLKTQPKALKQAYSEQALAQLEKQSAPEASNETAPQEKALVAEKAQSVEKKPVAPDAKENSAPAGEDDDHIDWGWPAGGRIVAGFSDANSGKGIDISGKIGQPVYASASGKVVYSGNGLRGYGKLIIIKHNKTYLSAYAHNNQILVKEGQNVVKGQKIGEMGSSDTDQVKLHFEIRRFGKPVDPAKYLPNERAS